MLRKLAMPTLLRLKRDFASFAHPGGGFTALEDEMADFSLDGLSSGRSPDRLDALVWAVTELADRAARPGPRIRSLGPDPHLVPI